MCVCSSVPLLCSLDPGQTKHTQTVAEMLRTNGDGHSGDPFQMENYGLGIFIACYMELFHPPARHRSLLIPKGEIQPTSHGPGQSHMGSAEAHFGVIQHPVCWVQKQQVRGEGMKHLVGTHLLGAALEVTATLMDHCINLCPERLCRVL